MAEEVSGTSSSVVAVLDDGGDLMKSSYAVKVGLAQMLRGGVIIDVTDVEQALIAEDAGAVAVMVHDKLAVDIRAANAKNEGSIARMCDPGLLKDVKKAVSIPVIAKARIGHFVEAQILEAIGADYVDESEILTPADEENHINKHDFRVPFICGCSNLGEALRRIAEGAAIIRTKGEAGSGNVVEAVKHARAVLGDMRKLQMLEEDELFTFAKQISAPYELVKLVKQLGGLPAVNFGAGGISTPADAALMMQLGCDGVFVGSGIFKSANPTKRARAIVQAVTQYNDSQVLANLSADKDL
jgi:pyridoxal 5'-phosphate synthase pdxS subunit